MSAIVPHIRAFLTLAGELDKHADDRTLMGLGMALRRAAMIMEQHEQETLQRMTTPPEMQPPGKRGK